MPKPVRVLHLIGAPRPGGAETFACRLFEALHKDKNANQHVLCRKGGWLAERLDAAKIPHTTAPFGGWWDARLPFFTHRIAQQAATTFQPDVILAWMNRGAAFVPVGPWAKAARLGGFYALKNYRGRVTDLIGNTPAIVAYCKAEGWPAEHVYHLTNFVPEPAKGWEKARAAQRKHWGWKPTDIGLILCGRLHEVKGIDVALHALSMLPPNFKLALVGEGDERVALKGLSTKLGLGSRVVFAGWADDIAASAAAADIWLAPSRHEPLGNTALDAWRHQRPLIAAQTGGLAMLVQHGKNGLLVPSEDADALAATIERLAGNSKLQTTLKKGGLASWQANYTEKSVVNAYLKLFHRLASAPR